MLWQSTSLQQLAIYGCFSRPCAGIFVSQAAVNQLRIQRICTMKTRVLATRGRWRCLARMGFEISMLKHVAPNRASDQQTVDMRQRCTKYHSSQDSHSWCDLRISETAKAVFKYWPSPQCENCQSRLGPTKSFMSIVSAMGPPHAVSPRGNQKTDAPGGIQSPPGK